MRCLSLPLSTLYFETGSLTEPTAQPGSVVQRTSLCPSTAGLQTDSALPCLSLWWLLEIGLGLCTGMASTLATEPSPCPEKGVGLEVRTTFGEEERERAGLLCP